MPAQYYGMQKKLSSADILYACDPASFTAGIQNKGHHNHEIIGQNRAIKALSLGLGMKAHGFNIYVAGASGTGKLTLVKSFLEEQAKKEPVPPDWCYVNNFKDPYHPAKLQLPAGMATGFKKNMKILIHDIYQSMIKAFESEDYADRKEKIISAFEQQQEKMVDDIALRAEQESFTIKQTPTGVIIIPLKDKKPITDKQFKELSDAEMAVINEKQDKLREEINTRLREIHKHEKTADASLDQLSKEVAEFASGNIIEELYEKYESSPDVRSHLQSVKEDILDNLSDFLLSSKDRGSKASNHQGEDFLKRYEVTVLVDNAGQKGAPVVIEGNPTYNNLAGRVEKESYMGTLVTDFTMIRKGSLHSANGGYLVIRIEEILGNYFSWDGLKRALKNKELVIEDATDQLGYVTTRTIKPEPIPLDIKVVLIGSALHYQLLYEYDSDFRELFKVKADFDSSTERNNKNLQDYYQFIIGICEKEKFLKPDNEAIAKIIEYSSRLAEDQYKLSTLFGKISDIIREANYYAAEEQSTNISRQHIIKAIEERVYRSNLIQEKINEMIINKQIFIDTEDSKVGQINGLSVISLGDISFGTPNRITCTISLGKEGVIAIEREAELSGAIHTKGVMILTGYLSGKFMQDKPVSLAARLVFEQSYSEIEGDSASSTELYTILSALSNLPLKQGIAVTGSVNQKGEIQPVGGINEKIEGYFEICKHMGLNGEQGVMIPLSNMRNLMLKEEIQDAVKENKFNIWAVDTIDDGIEILTGVKAGSIWEDGTVFSHVNNTLHLYAERMRAFSAPEEDEALELE